MISEMTSPAPRSDPDDPDPGDLLARLRDAPIFGDDMPGFDPALAPQDPLELFRSWILDAGERRVRAPQAFTLLTVASDGGPDGRIVVLRGVSDRGLRFATSRQSAKGRQLSAAPLAGAVFHWPELGRQIRARGHVENRGEAAASRESLSRSPLSKAEAIGGGLEGRAQSDRLENPAATRSALDRARAHIEADPAWVPAFWMLYELVPDEIEFWQADRDRAHVRLRYRRTTGGFTRELLWP